MTTFDLTANRHESRVLSDWMKARPGSGDRMRSNGSLSNNATVLSSDNEGMRGIFASIPSSSGYPVTARTAMQVSTVFACLSKLSGALSQLPIHEYTISAGGMEDIAPKSPLWWLLNESPHDMWTSASWMEWILYCVMIEGDQHTRIIRRNAASSAGEIIGLKPYHPKHVNPRRFKDRLVYDMFNVETGMTETVDQDDVLHFTNFSFNGIRSLSAIQNAAKNAIGNSLAAANFSGKSIGEGAMPQIALSYPNKLSPDQSKQLRDNFVDIYTGSGARKIPLIMTEGGKADPLNISPVDMELLGSRRFEREDICQALGVPPVLIGDNDKTSSWGTGIEQITLGFVRFTLKPHVVRWEQEMNRKLFRKAGRFIRYDFDGLLRGDSKAQADVFRSALGGPGTGDGYMSVNEIRKLKNLPPVAGRDLPYKAPIKIPSEGK